MTTPDTLTTPTVVAGIAAALEFLEGSDDPRADAIHARLAVAVDHHPELDALVNEHRANTAG